ncbi:putative sigma factor [Alkaliphilus metalliredigens QYMF]|uniref:Putative sigma factor n=1 Tax=Alkaliphilus metalliredigens (strain QYMF) TaxID=293826 RepID=A6TQU1_ALKMQ|nr:sigma factor [Alkaliphilus metalliredigens]ABR48559.1 putative sigma factor [Alkaliphilus metalliredigens QYMF]
MNYYKSTEKFLYNYNALKACIENMQCELEEMGEGNHIGIRGLSVKEKTSTTFEFNSMTENEAINSIERKDLLISRIHSIKRKITRIDRAIESIDQNEREIIEKRYLMGKQWWEIAYEVKFSERHCKRIRNEAIEKIAVALFGEDVLFTSLFSEKNVI